LALEELKERHDYELRLRELELKRHDAGWLGRLFSPVSTAVFAGIITVAGSVTATLMQSRAALDVERQKEQADLILKMVGVSDASQARANLDFLVESGLLDKSLAKSVNQTKSTPVIPPSNGAAAPSDSKAFEAVRNDDDAIDLVIGWEGGFYSGTNPDEARNAGIGVKDLASFLGRPATVSDLQNLSKDTIRDFYRIRLQPAEAIKVPMVRAAFLNLAVWTGAPNAMQTFQKAAAKVMAVDVTPDGILGPASISLINSVPDPNLFVETANCLTLDQLKHAPTWNVLGPNSLRRLRAFSPVTLRGICPELMAVTAESGTTAANEASTTH
jgi:lysozyme family protein